MVNIPNPLNLVYFLISFFLMTVPEVYFCATAFHDYGVLRLVLLLPLIYASIFIYFGSMRKPAYYILLALFLIQTVYFQHGQTFYAADLLLVTFSMDFGPWDVNGVPLYVGVQYIPLVLALVMVLKHKTFLKTA